MIRKYAEIFCWKNVSSFCSAKATHIFSAKNIKILYIESAKTVNEMTLNELVKLTTLWTTGPRIFYEQEWEADSLLTFFSLKVTDCKKYRTLGWVYTSGLNGSNFLLVANVILPCFGTRLGQNVFFRIFLQSTWAKLYILVVALKIQSRKLQSAVQITLTMRQFLRRGGSY